MGNFKNQSYDDISVNILSKKRRNKEVVVVYNLESYVQKMEGVI